MSFNNALCTKKVFLQSILTNIDVYYSKCIHDILCWEHFLQLIIDIGCCIWIIPLHHINSVLKQGSSNMNIFTNVRVNKMHHD
jgi:hypothetical protein